MRGLKKTQLGRGLVELKRRGLVAEEDTSVSAVLDRSDASIISKPCKVIKFQKPNCSNRCTAGAYYGKNEAANNHVFD